MNQHILLLKQKFTMLRQMGFYVSPLAAINFCKMYLHKKEVLFPKHLSPLVITLMLTNKCNISCPFCFWSDSVINRTDTVEVDFNFAESFLKNELTNKALVYHFEGGEVLLLNDKLEKIISLFRRANRITQITTNGVLLTKERALSLKESGLTKIIVSSYLHTADKLRQTLPEANQVFPVSISQILLKSLLTKQLEFLLSTLEFYVKIGVQYLTYTFCIPCGKNTASQEEALFANNRDDVLLFENFKRLVKQKFPNFPIRWNNLPYQCGMENPDGKYCNQVWHQIHFDCYGNMSLCPPYAHDKKYGNIFTGNDNDKSFNNKCVQELRKCFLDKSNKIVPDICNGCYMLNRGLQ